MGKVVELFREVDHALCRLCPHNETCESVCIGVETLVQILKEPKSLARLELLDNVRDQLDIENSFDGKEESLWKEQR